jgi:ankyrin repeat protein
VNEQDEQGSTPLHYAAINDNYEAVLMLTVLAFQKIKLDVINFYNYYYCVFISIIIFFLKDKR